MKIPSAFRPYEHYTTTTLIEEVKWFQDNPPMNRKLRICLERMKNELKRRNA